MTEKRIKIPRVYVPLFDCSNWNRTVNYYLLDSGRNGGKTTIITAFLHWVYEEYPRHDIIIFIPALKEEKSTLKTQLESYLKEYGLDGGFNFNSNGFVTKDGHENRIYLYPAQSNAKLQMNVSKGLTTHLPVSLILVDELQKMHGEEIVHQFLNTALKKLMFRGFCIFAMNEEQNAPWASRYVRRCVIDPSFIVIKSTYKDLGNLLPQSIRDKIAFDFKTDPTLARQLYLNDMTAKGWEVVYPTFDESKHYKRVEELPVPLCNTLKKDAIKALVFGMDFASNADATTSIPIAVTSTKSVCALYPRFRYSPTESNAILAPSKLNDGIIQNIKTVIDSYNVRRGTPIYIVADCASAANIAELKASLYAELLKMRYDLACKYTQFFESIVIVPFVWKDDKNANLMRVRNLFSHPELIYILHDGTKQFDLPEVEGGDQLTYEIISQRYKESKDNKKVLDASVPNDSSDGLEYGLLYIFLNPHSQYAFQNSENIAALERKDFKNKSKMIRIE